MFGLDIQCLPADCVATTLLQCLKGSIKVDSVLDASRIAWYLQHIKKEEYETEQANYEAQDPQAEYRSWEVFVRNAILVQILETKPRNRRVEFYNKGEPKGFGIRKVSGRKKKQPNHEFHEARHRLAQRADEEYRRYCQRHPHRSERNGRRGLQLDPIFDDEDEDPSAMPYREFFIRFDPSFYAVKRCAESLMDTEKGHKDTREPVREAAPPPSPAPFHHGPGAFTPERFRYNAAPPMAPFQEGGGSISPSDDEGASSANGGRGSSRASSHSAAFHSHGAGREHTHGLDRGAVIFPDTPHQQPTRPSETTHGPVASPIPSHREPSRASSRASSDRHTTSSSASSRASSRAPSHTFSDTHMASSASSSLDGTRAVSHAAFDEIVAIPASSARRPSRSPSQASVYSANKRPSGPPNRQPLQAPANEPTSGSFRSPAATAGEAALVRAAIVTSSQLSVPGNKQLRTPTQLGHSRMPSMVTVNGADPTLSISLNRPRPPYAASYQSASDSGLHSEIQPRGSKDGFLGSGIQERDQSRQSSRASSHASSGRPPLPFLHSGNHGGGQSFAMTNKNLPEDNQPPLPSVSGSRRASSNRSSSTTTPKAQNKETLVVIGSGHASSRGSNSTTTRISKGKEPASRFKAKGAADSSEISSDESDIESISSWHSGGGRGPPKWGNRECLARGMVSGKPG